MGSSRGKMPETKVPMTLRDAFLEDPFFRMDTSKNMKVAEQKEERRSGRMPWLMPRKMEVHLDTVGYKPDELKVEVENGVVRVEGRHHEKSESGQVMVSRQFARQYALPQGAKPEEVVSSLSKDGVLAIHVPKQAPKKLSATRAVPIDLK